MQADDHRRGVDARVPGRGCASGPGTIPDAIPSTGFVGGVVLVKQGSHLLTAMFTQHAMTVSNLMDDGAGIPIYITCVDDSADRIVCSLYVFKCPTPFVRAEAVASAGNTELGLSIVEAHIPASEYADSAVTILCAVVGINGVQMTLETLVITEAV